MKSMRSITIINPKKEILLESQVVVSQFQNGSILTKKSFLAPVAVRIEFPKTSSIDLISHVISLDFRCECQAVIDVNDTIKKSGESLDLVISTDLRQTLFAPQEQ